MDTDSQYYDAVFPNMVENPHLRDELYTLAALNGRNLFTTMVRVNQSYPVPQRLSPHELRTLYYSICNEFVSWQQQHGQKVKPARRHEIVAEAYADPRGPLDLSAD